jgi:WD40 repeat protein
MNVVHSMTRSGLLLLAVTGVVEAQQGNAASYEIAYTGMCEGSYRTCMANADGSRARPLGSFAFTSMLQPGWWSPDGGQLLGFSASGVRVLNVSSGAEDTLPARLMGLDMQMVWSPDSTRIAFASPFEDPHLNDADVQRGRALASTAIYVADIQSKKLTKLSALGQNRWISWAPDAKRVVFSGTEPGVKKSDIYVADAAAGNPRRIFSGPTNNVQPAWSPRGDQIVFLATPLAGTKPEDSGIFVVRPDGTMPRRVSPLYGPTVTWSPDGRLLSICRSTAGGSQIIEAATGKATLLGNDAMLDCTVAPDGRSVIFRTSDQGKGAIWAIDVDGSKRRKLVEGSFFAVSPLLKR